MSVEDSRGRSNETPRLVARFEEMIRAEDSFYFDLDELEVIVEHYFENSRLKEALKVVHYANTLFPNQHLIMLREAQIIAVMGNLSGSLEKLNKLIDIEPFNDEVYLTIASVYSQLRKPSKAIENYKLALKYGENGFRDEIFIDLALEYENMNDYARAIGILKKALIENPNHETATYELAHCFETVNRPDEALVYYQAFIDENPYAFNAWYNLGNLYLKLEQPKNAVNAYEYCLAIEEEFTPAWFNMANAFIQLEDFQKAIEAYEETIKLEEPQASTYCYLGECHEKLEQLDQAEVYYDLSLEKNKIYPDAFIGKAVVENLRGNCEKAIAFLNTVEELDPENTEVLLLKAETLRNMLQYKEALKIYEKLVMSDPHLIEAWLDLSDHYFVMNEFSLAFKTIERGLGNNPHNGALLKRKVAYLHAQGKRKESLLLLDYLFASDYTEMQELTEYYPDILSEQEALVLFNSQKA